MPKKTLKRQRKQRGGKVGMIPIIDDIGRVLYNKFHENPIDKAKKRMSIIAKTNALKDLISWIELSLGNITRSAFKSHDPIITQIANRFVFNKFNEDWFSKNLVTEAQLDDYFEHMDTLEGELKQYYINVFSYGLIRYLKQIYILIVGSTAGSVFDNTENYEKILFTQKKDLPKSSDFIVSQQYSAFLTKKFGETYLNILNKNYVVVSDFINYRIKPILSPVANTVEILPLAAAIAQTPAEQWFDNNNQIKLKEVKAELSPEHIYIDDTEHQKTSGRTSLPVASASRAGGTRKKQNRRKPRKNKTTKTI
jgi:hypothetical protein